MNAEQRYDEESLQHMYALLQKHDIETIFRMALEVTQSRMSINKKHLGSYNELTCGRSSLHIIRLPVLTHVVWISSLRVQHRLLAIITIVGLFSLRTSARGAPLPFWSQRCEDHTHADAFSHIRDF